MLSVHCCRGGSVMTECVQVEHPHLEKYTLVYAPPKTTDTYV